MAYQGKTDWKYDDTVREQDMNRIEKGVSSAHALLEGFVREIAPSFVATEGGARGLVFTPSGLTASWTAGVAYVNGVRFEVPAGTIQLLPSKGQFLYLDTNGTVKITTDVATAEDKCPLYHFITDENRAMTTIDRRRSVGIANQSDLKAHMDNKNNPHGVTPYQIGAETPFGAQSKVDAHAGQDTDAHEASAISIKSSYFSATDVLSALIEVNKHSSRTNNPHYVTAAQTGAIPTSEKGAPLGVAPLDSDGQVPVNQLKKSPLPAEIPHPLWIGNYQPAITTSSMTAPGHFLSKGSTSLNASSTNTSVRLHTLSLDWRQDLRAALEVVMRTSSGYTAYAALWDLSTSEIVSGSTVSTTSGSATIVRSPILSNLVRGRHYGVTVWQSSSGQAYLHEAHLIFFPKLIQLF